MSSIGQKVAEMVELEIEKVLVDYEINHFILSAEELQKLYAVFGRFNNGSELVQAVLNLGNIKIQGREFQIDSAQIKRLKEQALFYELPTNKPADGLTKEEIEEINTRYLDKVLSRLMKQFAGEV